jgi:hypothetical protein
MNEHHYVCSYRLPCSEKVTCTCVPDAVRWFCNVDCPDGLRQACEFNSAGYTCSACGSFSSLAACIDSSSLAE